MLGNLSHRKLVNQPELVQLLRDKQLEWLLSSLRAGVELPVLGSKEGADSVLAGVANALRLSASPIIESLPLGTEAAEVANRTKQLLHLQAEVLNKIGVLVVGRDLIREPVELCGRPERPDSHRVAREVVGGGVEFVFYLFPGFALDPNAHGLAVVLL